MTPLAILQESDPLLRVMSQPIDEFGKWLRDFAWHMNETMQSRHALGLAAIQVAVDKRLILVRDQDTHRVIAMANPRIVRTLNRSVVMQEGCLSIGNGAPRRWIDRPAKCEVAWQDLQGAEQTGNFAGWTARAILHEIDHLDGVLMTDKPSARG